MIEGRVRSYIYSPNTKKMCCHVIHAQLAIVVVIQHFCALSIDCFSAMQIMAFMF